jgi:ribosomal RNA-processing protein 17
LSFEYCRVLKKYSLHQMREERRKDAEAHVAKVNQMLRESGAIPDDEGEDDAEGDGEPSDNWEGFPDKPDLEIVDHEEEYIDEDRYTTVTVETIAVTRDGFDRPKANDEDDERKSNERKDADKTDEKIVPKLKRPKKKQPKFRYESRMERQMTDRKQRAKSKASKAKRQSSSSLS